MTGAEPGQGSGARTEADRDEFPVPRDRRVLDPHPEMQRATLCHPLRDGEMLLMEKRRGVGEGNLVAPGGKVEPGERPREAAHRETREELGIEIHEVEKVGELAFTFGEDPFMFVDVFRTRSFSGTPEASEEGIPEWHSTADPPYDRMWPDDRHWMPAMLNGEGFVGEFRFDADGEEMLEYDLERGVEF